MSLGIAVKGTEGVVLAADSRVNLTGTRTLPDGEEQPINVDFDNTNKLIHFADQPDPNYPHKYFGVVTYGQALIGRRTPFSFKPELELELPEERQEIEEYARLLQEFYQQQWEEHGMPPAEDWAGQEMTFFVVGYDPDSPYGRIFQFSIPGDQEPIEQRPDDFGMAWGGEVGIVTRLIKGFDPRILANVAQETDLDVREAEELLVSSAHEASYVVPYEVLPLQDCVNLAILMIRTTIDLQSLAIGPRGVGGRIEVATITRSDGLEFVQRKQLQGEGGFRNDQ